MKSLRTIRQKKELAAEPPLSENFGLDTTIRHDDDAARKLSLIAQTKSHEASAKKTETAHAAAGDAHRAASTAFEKHRDAAAHPDRKAYYSKMVQHHADMRVFHHRKELGAHISQTEETLNDATKMADYFRKEFGLPNPEEKKPADDKKPADKKPEVKKESIEESDRPMLDLAYDAKDHPPTRPTGKPFEFGKDMVPRPVPGLKLADDDAPKKPEVKKESIDRELQAHGDYDVEVTHSHEGKSTKHSYRVKNAMGKQHAINVAINRHKAANPGLPGTITSWTGAVKPVSENLEIIDVSTLDEAQRDPTPAQRASWAAHRATDAAKTASGHLEAAKAHRLAAKHFNPHSSEGETHAQLAADHDKKAAEFTADMGEETTINTPDMNQTVDENHDHDQKLSRIAHQATKTADADDSAQGAAGVDISKHPVVQKHLLAYNAHRNAANHHIDHGNADAAAEHRSLADYHRDHLVQLGHFDESVNEEIKTNNPGFGYHGSNPDHYARTHRKVKMLVGMHPTVANSKTPNKVVTHYLDSVHGRHLVGHENDHDYVRRDFNRFAKRYDPAHFEKDKFDESYQPDEESVNEWKTMTPSDSEEAKKRGEAAVKKIAQGSHECPYCKEHGFEKHDILNHIKKESTDLNDCLVTEGLSEEELQEWGKPININLKITQAAKKAVEKNAEGDKYGQMKALQRVADLRAQQHESVENLDEARFTVGDTEAARASAFAAKHDTIASHQRAAEEHEAAAGKHQHGSKQWLHHMSAVEHHENKLFKHLERKGYGPRKESVEQIDEAHWTHQGESPAAKLSKEASKKKTLLAHAKASEAHAEEAAKHKPKSKEWFHHMAAADHHEEKAMSFHRESVEESIEPENDELSDKDSKEMKRLETLIRLGLMDAPKLQIVRRAFAKLEKNQIISNPQERAVMMELLNDLISLVTGDDSTFAKVKVSVGH